MNTRIIILIVVIAAIVGSIVYLDSQKIDVDSGAAVQADVELNETERTAMKEAKYEHAKEITTPDAFINTDGITVGELIGKKVILVDFWTYSCINCQRTFPYLNAWYDKYRDKGLEILAIHTPEFEFEKKLENVQKATENFGIEYPVILDNDYSTWQSYKNRYWPRKYLIDIDGYIVYDHIGEGAYDETEAVIQQLLAERNAVLGENQLIDSGMVNPENTEVAVAQSPETYFGAWRNDLLANGDVRVEGQQDFILPEAFQANVLYLGGTWNIEYEYAESVSNSAIIFDYNAKNVFMVARADTPIRAEVLIDGKPPRFMPGADLVEENGRYYVTIQEDRLYRLIENENGIANHTIEIRPEEPGLQVYTFTFG